MPTYVILTKFTGPGIENVVESPARTEEAREHIESVGGELREFFVVMGRYDGVLVTVRRALTRARRTLFDGVLVADFPDDETAAGAVLALGQSGNVTTETLKAFDLDEFREIVDHVEEAG